MRLGEGKRADDLAAGHARQPMPLLSVGAVDDDAL
jgi:hypothetical protein